MTNTTALPDLDEKTIHADPIQQFRIWFKEAISEGVSEPEAMFLATAGNNGKPSGRIVLMKGFDKDGFVFYTNYNSAKGSDLRENPFASLTFYWKDLKRQVRINGTIKRVSKKESDHYFYSRPLESQVSAMISPQSSVIPGREFLDKQVDEYLSHPEKMVKRPASWGGFRVKPAIFEFWQGREHRLHDRIRYSQTRGKWKIERLAP